MAIIFEMKKLIKDELEELHKKICECEYDDLYKKFPSTPIVAKHLEFFHRIIERLASFVDGNFQLKEELYDLLEFDSFMPEPHSPFEKSKAEEEEYYKRIVDKLENLYRK